MAGIRTDKIYKNFINNISKEYDIVIKNHDNFKINYSKDKESKSGEFILWRKSGDIVKSESISYDFKYSILTLDNIYYLVIENYNDKVKIDFLEEIELNLGHFIYLYKSEDYYPQLNQNLEEYDILDILDTIDEDYKFHDFDDIKKIFVDIRVFKISQECPFDFDDKNIDNTIYRIISLILVDKYKSKRFTYLKEDTLDEYVRIIRRDLKYFPYDNIMQSLLENKPSKVFLEIYRVIERLYPYIMVKKFKESIGKREINEDIFSIYNALKSINWSHNEEDSIIELFDSISLEPDEHIKELMKSTGCEDMNIGKWIYRIRNMIVHLSLEKTSKDIDVSSILKTDLLIGYIIKSLDKIYVYCFGEV